MKPITECFHCSRSVATANAAYSQRGEVVCDNCLKLEELAKSPAMAAGGLEYDAPGPHCSSGSGAVGGVIMMAAAAIWFVGGLAVGIVYFYSPILFVIGLFVMANNSG